MKAQFEKRFFSVGLQSEIDKIYNNCHYCSTQRKIPTLFEHHTQTEVSAPGSFFHADVIKRASQKILIIRDHFSSYTNAKFIKAENNKELKQGIIDLVMPIKLKANITIKVDNATGFSPLLNNKDYDLEKLNIRIVNTDPFNKNENALVDKACQELETEIKTLEPDGRPISSITLLKALDMVNTKLRRNGKLAFCEKFFQEGHIISLYLNSQNFKLIF